MPTTNNKMKIKSCAKFKLNKDHQVGCSTVTTGKERENETTLIYSFNKQ